MSVPRKRMVLSLLAMITLLAGCGQTPEERIEEGLEDARAAFEQEPAETNETVNGTELYLPRAYTIEEPSDANNVIVTRGSDSFVLFLNPNEAADSTFFYELQKANDEQEWAADETFQQNGRFGFATVRKIAEERFEIVTSSGGVKMTTISEESEIADNMDWMMKTVRSIDEK